jgi:hypothetical protein
MTLESLLQHSLDQYRQLLDKLEEIARMLKTGRAAAVGPSLETWLQLQQEARRTDAQIAELGDRQAAAVRSCPSFEAWQTLMKALGGRCREIFGQATAHQALIRDELMRLREGRTAINCYKSLPTKPGNRICSRQ